MDTYRVSMMKDGVQQSKDDVIVQASNPFEAKSIAEQMRPGYKAVIADKLH